MNNFEKRIKNLSSDIWLLLNQINELKGQWIGGAQLNPQALGRLKRSVLVTSTGASTRIEGARLTDNEIEKLMRGLSLQKLADRDKQEVQGYYELLDNVFSSWNSIPFTESTIKHLHKELLKYADKDERHRGKYKAIENQVEILDESGKTISVLFAPTPAYLTPKAMQELMNWTNEALVLQTTHPLLIISNFVVEFLKIHPFQDGNGRLSRILANLLMLKYGYAYMPYVSHEKLIEDNKADYYLALRQSQKTFGAAREDISVWTKFFLNILLTQAKQAIDLLSAENIKKLLSPKQLAVWRCLESGEEITPGEIAKATKVARPTVSQALDKLLQLKKIERLGQGRTTRYKKV
ncbi:MAG: Fic family protein [Patescibacteria group bacterium]|jgi:Fic family protein